MIKKRSLLSAAGLWHFLTTPKKALSLLHSSKGAALVEFAIVAPIFIILFLVVIELTIMLIIQNALDAAVREAGRYGITGNNSSSQTRGQSIIGVMQQTAVNYSLGLVDPTQLNIYASFSTSLQNASSITPGTPSTNFGGSGQTSSYLLTYNWNTHIPLLGNNGTVTLKAQSIFVNESY